MIGNFNPLKGKSLGPSRNGTLNWVVQRVTGVLIMIIAYRCIMIIRDCFISAEPVNMAANLILSSGCDLFVFWLFICLSIWHGSIGIGVIMRDYISCSSMRLCALIFVNIINIITVLYFSFLIIKLFVKNY